uniref:RETREG1-3/ARL6IP-like N-terminal reticulon-homology domain-containing protein n=1 Tax=Meleagris gallopavo TaxID=9103 RepID=G1N6X4_MELGA
MEAQCRSRSVRAACSVLATHGKTFYLCSSVFSLVTSTLQFCIFSFSFLMIYYLDPSVLSGVSCFVMFICLADYLVPALAPRIFGSNKWTTEQQQRFHEICSNLVKSRRRIVGWWKRLFALKEEKPKMYFMTMLCSLAVVAWIGQQVHNLFLTYLIVSFLLLFPGLNQHGIITKYVGMAKREINKLLKHKEKKNE